MNYAINKREKFSFIGFVIGKYLVEKIRDAAGQKGTGKWTAISALDYGVPVTLIGESVFSRCLSALLCERQKASKQLNGPCDPVHIVDKKKLLEELRQVNCIIRNTKFFQ